MNPPSGDYRRDERCQSKVSEQTVRITFPPMDHLYMAACLETGGAECRIADYPALGRGWDAFRNDLASFKPDMLILSSTTPTLESDLEAARQAKATDPEMLVMLKGGYFFKYDEEPFRKVPALDVVIRHEYEFVTLDIAKGKPLDSIAGITYRQGDRIVRNPMRDFSDELDSLPFPARHLIDNSLYTSPENGKPIGVIHTSKGCPSRCIFCPAGPISGYKVRLRSPKSVVEELAQCVQQYGLTQFLFNADTFTWDKNFVVAVCQGIMEKGLQIRWGCNSKVNTLDSEMLELMKRAGCWVVGFGIESGSQEMLNKMRKGTTLEQAQHAIALCKKAGLKTHTFFIIGLPWDTSETIKKSEEFARRLDADYFDFNIAYPLPGTEYWDIVKENNLFEDCGIENQSYANSPVRSFTLSHDDLVRLRRHTLLRLYLRPNYIVRTLAREVSNPSVFVRYCYYALRRLGTLVHT
ncbi:MAG: radical SAM protein [Candidatus Abyssubacteria bacterium]